MEQITILGKTYTAEEASAPFDEKSNQACGLSRLQLEFREKYGSESFEASIADFLAEWFNPLPVLKVQTSGSTGTPKELWVEKERMRNSARLTVAFLGLQAGDSALICMPLKYIGGKMVIVRALIAGLNLIPVTPSGHPMATLETAPVFAAMTPMQVFNSIQIATEKERLEQIQHLIIGGGAIDNELAQVLKKFPKAVWSTYGMTETLSHIALRRLSGPEASEWYTPFSQVSLSLSAEGTLIIQAPTVNPETLVTNDLVTFNSEGQFRIIGRKDNVINTGGVKVQIEQIETLLKPRLTFDIQITGVPDPKFGERIVLLAETGENLNDRQRNLLEEAFNSLPPYWRPKETIPVPSLPKTGSGKPDRATARRIARTYVKR